MAGWSAAVVVLVVLAGARFGSSSARPSAGGPNDTQVVNNGAVPSTSASRTAASPTAASSTCGAVPGRAAVDRIARRPRSGTAAARVGGRRGRDHPPGGRFHGPFTASEVAAAYATTRKLLIAQNLDQSTLRGGAPTAFADVLTPQQRSQFIAGLDKIGLGERATR